ncbi:hypothetical protein [Mesorhizobium sp. B4-1-4]|uniref:hypothetical protein n=1 Tax=Mesorhizobium sp. B4-1-4 TaxID=2589888 RepID=UPI00112B312C|nr:hypothetical protein [Mesorhizobium sp. B4-1-4]UCI33227.1 hypothetical protein FJW03_07285 [Mesorhizobium sp. B4-1-4]
MRAREIQTGRKFSTSADEFLCGSNYFTRILGHWREIILAFLSIECQPAYTQAAAAHAGHRKKFP